MRIMAMVGGLVMMAASGIAVADSTVTQGAVMKFDESAQQLMIESREKRIGLRFHVNGEVIGGRVVELREDAVLVANQEHGRILIRLDRIDAIAAP
jgi:hypothetical protein